MAKDIIINGEILRNVSKLSFMTDEGVKVTFQEESEFAPLTTSASLFTFKDGIITSYNGEATQITLPTSYSIKYETNRVTAICKIKDPSDWGSSIQSRWSYINSLTFTDGVVTRIYTDYYAMYSGIYYNGDFEDWTKVYLIGLNFKNYSARNIFNQTSSAYNFVEYPIAFNYGGKTYTYETYSGTDTTSGDSITMLSLFQNVYQTNTDMQGGEIEISKEIYIDGDDYQVIGIGNTSAVFENKDVTTVVIPEQIKNIGDYAFAGLSKITNIELPADTINIGKYAFSGCTSMSNFTIPNGITTLNEYTFQNCDALESLEIPSSVTTMKYGVFSYCDNLKTVTFDPLTSISEIGGGCFMSSGLEEIVIPDSVTILNNQAFAWLRKLKKVKIGKNVSYIPSGCFSGLDSLEEIIVDQSNKTFKDNNCNAVFTKIPVTLDYSMEYPADSLIFGCKTTVIPVGTKCIARDAFDSNESITSITIPEGVTELFMYAFHRCTNLEYISLPSTLRTIYGYAAISECPKLTELILPQGLTTLKPNCLYGNDGLTTISIPSSVTDIGAQVFSSSDGLQTAYVYCTSSVTKITSASDGWFAYCPDDLVIHAKSTLNATTSKTKFGDYWNYKNSSKMFTTIYDL